MKKLMILAVLVISTAAIGSDLGLGLANEAGPRRWHNRRGSGDRAYSVAEPQAIALLGAGLVSLGIYAKKRQGKKR